MSASDGELGAHNGGAQLRLDKWLWFARVVKSRTLAAGLVADGKVRLNRERTTKPSQMVRVGDVITVAVGPRIRVLEIVAMGARRGPASEAQGLYIDRSPPPAVAASPTVSPPSAEREAGSGRPTKRDRRMIDRFKERE
jgi:ribosome-associated heat shock protein Hsp15